MTVQGIDLVSYITKAQRLDRLCAVLGAERVE